MPDITIISANLGGYDVPRPQAAQGVDVDWLMVVDTDDPLPEPWTAVTMRHHCRRSHPRLVAKVPKCAPWSLPIRHARHVIWLDANMEVTSPTFAVEAVDAIRDGIGLWRHPQRRCVYAEAQASLRLCPDKYRGQPIVEQVASYRAEGHPANGGLYACGTVAWDTGDRRALAVGKAWLAEIARWSYQDQLSLPVVCRRLGVTPGVFPVAQIGRRRRGMTLENRWLRIHDHLSAA